MILMDDVAVAVDISIFSSDLLVYANATVSQSILEFFFSVFLVVAVANFDFEYHCFRSMC